jgi:hypothetical protein
LPRFQRGPARKDTRFVRCGSGFEAPPAARRDREGLAVLPGVADVVVVAPDKILFLEIKAGSPVSPEQREFGMRVTELGFVWPVLRSLDDVGNAIAAVGIEVCNIEELSP